MNDETIGLWIEAMAAVMDLRLDAADKDEIARNLVVAQKMASLVQGASCDERTEPLPVYRP